MKTVTIYTDGACSGNPGPGGWGAILLYGPHKRELSGGEAETTNNRMELTAVIQALSLLKEPCIVELWSDSKYVIDGLSKGWAKGWKARGWVKSDKKPALNPDLWEELLRLEAIHTLQRAGLLAQLPDKLQLTAALRLENPELPLSELAEEFDPPVTKSCLNHRLRKLMELAKSVEE